MGMLTGRQGLWDRAEISPAMAGEMETWRRAFYREGPWSGGAGLPATLTGYAATLVTNELELRWGTGDRAAYFAAQTPALTARLHEAVQLAAVFGWAVLRPVVEEGKFCFQLWAPGQVFPTRFSADGAITAGYFADRRGEYLRVEEFSYGKGTLTLRNRAYRARGEVLGQEVPLSVRPEWENISPELVLSGLRGPLFGVIKMPFANTVEPVSPLPVSLYAGALESMAEFDRVYGDFLYELHSGRRKNIIERGAIVPEGRRKPRQPGTNYLDPTTDTYILDPQEEHSPFQDYSPEIRTEQYLSGLKTILHIIENQCHLSPGSLSIDQRTGAMTATEVISQDKTTYNTCAAIQNRGLTPGLLAVMDAMEDLADLYGLAPAGDTQKAIVYGDGIFEDTQKEFERRMEMAREGVIGKDAVREWYFGKEDNTH